MVPGADWELVARLKNDIGFVKSFLAILQEIFSTSYSCMVGFY